MIDKVRDALQSRYFGGHVLVNLGAVKGDVGMGTTADLQKATGEIRVHVVQDDDERPAVTVELPQLGLPGDSEELVCVRLLPSQAERLANLLTDAAAQAGGAY